MLHAKALLTPGASSHIGGWTIPIAAVSAILPLYLFPESSSLPIHLSASGPLSSPRRVHLWTQPSFKNTWRSSPEADAALGGPAVCGLRPAVRPSRRTTEA